MQQKKVLIRQPQRMGPPRMVKATVLQQRGSVLRVVPEGSNKPIEVKASETCDAARTFGTYQAADRGMVVQKAYPDSPNSMVRILQSRGF